MKRALTILAGAIACGAALTMYAASVPRLGCIYYGQVRNWFGMPCNSADGVRLTALRAGSTLTWCDVGTGGTGLMNYSIPINVVAPGPAPEAGTVAEGETVLLTATLGGAPVHLIGNTNLVATGGGVCVRRDFIVGTDHDADGLPDEWELFMLAAIGPGSGLTAIEQIRPGDDYDGDGASNIEEFLAGTFAFLAADVLRIEGWRQAGDNFEMTFYGSAGITYEVRTTADPMAGAWEVVRVAASPMATADASTVKGAGDVQSLYFATNGCYRFFQLFTK